MHTTLFKLALIFLAFAGIFQYFRIASVDTPRSTPIARIQIEPAAPNQHSTKTSSELPKSAEAQKVGRVFQELDTANGSALVASHTHVIKNRKTKIDVTIRCLEKTKSLSLKIAGFSDDITHGERVRDTFSTRVISDFGTDRVAPVGRMKILGQWVPLFPSFYLAENSHVIEWDPIATKYFIGGLDFKRRRGQAIGESPADVLRRILPIIVEVSNAKGTMRIELAQNRYAFIKVLRACSTRA